MSCHAITRVRRRTEQSPPEQEGNVGWRTYLIILGEELGEFLMPPFRCFFLGDNADCWSSSTATEGRRYQRDGRTVRHQVSGFTAGLDGMELPQHS